MYTITDDNELIYDGRKVGTITDRELFETMINDQDLILRDVIKQHKTESAYQEVISQTAENNMKNIAFLLDRTPDLERASITCVNEARKIALQFLRWKDDFMKGRLQT